MSPKQNHSADPRLTIYTGLSANEQARLDALVSRKRLDSGAYLLHQRIRRHALSTCWRKAC